MATGPAGAPTPQDARRLLRQLEADENAVRYPPLPRWFFIAQAAALAGLYLAQLLPPEDARNATFAVAVAAVVLGCRWWLHRDQVSWVSPKAADMGPFLAAVLGTGVLCVVLEATTGAWWVWIIGAAVAAGVVVRTGAVYRREFGDGR